MTALKNKQIDKFLEMVPATQHAEHRPHLTDMPFFNTIKDYKIDPDLGSVGDKTARKLVTFTYPDGYFSVFTLWMKKENNKWLIDFEKSYNMRQSDGGFQALKVIH